jgi:4-hydroxy-4-methyl-2-oxoglutarate aldolase
MAGTAVFRVFRNFGRPPEALVARFRNVPTGNISDAMDRFGSMDYGIRPLDPALLLCGPALTVRTRPGDNAAIYKALEEVKHGDVIVLATYDYTVGSTFGALWLQAAKNAGVAGVVCDGLCRDVSDIRSLRVPVCVRGTNPGAPFKHGPAEIGGPVSCGGVSVSPGDVVCGDEDGVVVVPQRDLERVAGALETVRKKEEAMLATISSGAIMPDDVRSLLAQMKTEYVE